MGEPTEYEASADAGFRRLKALHVRCVRALWPLLIAGLFVPAMKTYWVTSRTLGQQDIWLLLLVMLLSDLIYRRWRERRVPFRFTSWQLATVALLVLAFCYIGHQWILSGYDLSRDEQMARFDAWIFAQGRLAWPLPAAWQTQAAALNLEFMLPVERPVAWVSGYLPMNALLHAGLGALTGPLLTALCLPLLWAVVRRIWPQDREAAIVAVLMLVGSGQFLLAGMTAYAMTAHLFFNLLWLWLFLNDRRWSDGSALIVGFVATGLHQPLFHPMFVAPLLLLTVVERRWGRAGLFAIGYAAIGLFWLAWPGYIHGLVTGPVSVSAGSGIDYASRLRDTLSFSIATPTMMAANLLRFAVWQNLLLLPLLVVGVRVVRRDRLAAALLAGLILPIMVMTIILPYQGLGFGYRYLHGVLGNAVLLAVFGWRALAASHARLRPMVLKSTAASLLVVLPVQAWMAHARYQPWAQASAKIARSGAGYVLIEAARAPLVQDEVLNRPDLSNRPIRLIAEQVVDPDSFARRICRGGMKIAYPTERFYAPFWEYFRADPRDAEPRLRPDMAAPYVRAGCTIVPLS